MSQPPRPGVRALALLTAASLTGCASSTLILSDPSGATLYVNDSRVGRTPYPYRDSRISGSKVRLRLEKEGYEPFKTTLVRNEAVEWSAVVGAAFTLFLTLPWALGYEPEHTYVLKPSGDVPPEDWEKDVRPQGESDDLY